MRLLLISISLALAGCSSVPRSIAPQVVYKSYPPGAQIFGPAYGGGSYTHITPWTLYYPDLKSSFKEGFCSYIQTPSVRWPDGTQLPPTTVCVKHRYSEWAFVKPAAPRTYQPEMPSPAPDISNPGKSQSSESKAPVESIKRDPEDDSRQGATKGPQQAKAERCRRMGIEENSKDFALCIKSLK